VLFVGSRKVWGQALIFALVLSLAWPSHLIQAQSSQTQSSSTDRPLTQALLADPTLGPLLKGEKPLPRLISENPPLDLLDQNPYFLRGQRWDTQTAAPATAPASLIWTRYRETTQGLWISRSDADRELLIPARLKPLVETEQFLFLKNSDPNEPNRSFGLFVVDKLQLEVESFRPGRPEFVPVYSLPLFSPGWDQAVRALVFPGVAQSDDLIAFFNGAGEPEIFTFTEIRELLQIQNQVKNLATAAFEEESQNLVRRSIEVQAFPTVALPRGSTAVNGLFFTGLDLDHPQRQVVAQNAKNQTSWRQLPHLIAAKLATWILPKAQAAWPSIFGWIHPDMRPRFARVAGVGAGVFAISWLIKKFVVRDRLMQIRAYREKIEDEERAKAGEPPVDRSSRRFRATRYVREWFDVYVPALNLTVAGTAVISGFTLQYLVERFTSPELRNTPMARWVLNSYLNNREQNEKLKGNAATFVPGALINGTIDGGSVYLQLLYLNDYVLPFVGAPFDPEKQAQLLEKLRAENKASGSHLNETAAVAAGYLNAGGTSFSSNQTAKIREEVIPVIREKMFRRGKNPDDPRYENEFQRRVQGEVEKQSVALGLPSDGEFLFASTSVGYALAKRFGYRPPDAAEGIHPKKDSFVLMTDHWGHISLSLKRMIAAAEDLHKRTNHPAALWASEKGKDFLHRYRFIRRSLTNPGQLRANNDDALEVRHTLTLLSYDGQVLGTEHRFWEAVPGANESPQGAKLFTQLFRQSLFGLISEKHFLLQPSKADEKRLRPEAERVVAERKIQEVGSEELTALEKELLVQEAIKERLNDERKERAIADWKPKSFDWLERRQMAKADAYAEGEVAKKNIEWQTKNLDLTVMSNQAAKTYREAYRAKLLELVGLYVTRDTDTHLVDEVLKSADHDLELSLRDNEGLKRHLETLNDDDRLKLISHMHAQAFIDKYIQLTDGTDAVVPLTAKEQPGRFQKARYAAEAKKDSLLGRLKTKALRFAEGFFDSRAHRPGWESWRGRNIPFAGDTWTSLKIRVRSLAVLATATYFSQNILWQGSYDWDMYLFRMFTMGTATYVLTQTLNRTLMNLGIRPFDLKSKHKLVRQIGYAILFAWVTYPAYFPMFMFQGNFAEASAAVKAVTVEPVKALCHKLLGG
jgi:hypothetical protein